MQIHFVCSGNTYRSRMAEAYCNSLQIPKLTAVSSGIRAELDKTPIEWYAERIMEKYGLANYATLHWRQTNRENIAASDVIIFFEPEHYEFTKQFLSSKRQKYEVWNIKDINSTNDQDLIAESEKCFKLIKNKVDSLITALQKKTLVNN